MKLFFSLLAFWLLLNESVAPGHVLLGAALALAGVLVHRRLEPAASARSRPVLLAQLIAVVLADIARSNLAVARIVLGLGAGRRKAGFLSLPLELRHPGGLAVIACIITATPGTSWVRYDAAQNTILVHVLDLVDETEWIRIFKEHYERRLKEIFE
jgi:multicomponent K+:H+ antiporter subunit E